MRPSSLVLALAIACPLGPARADGAFPDELSVYLPPSEPDRIMLGANFGLVISEDAGRNWRFVCELYITRSGLDTVNFYKVASDGAILAVTFVNLWRSTDGGCTWTRAAGTLDKLATSDAFIDPVDPAFVVALATDFTSSGIYPSHDGGLTFGPALYSTLDRLVSVEIARSDHDVIYATRIRGASGSSTGLAWLLKSTDRGVHWSEQQLAVPAGTEVRIAAVDPDDPDKVYLRMLALSSSTDSIAITRDAGKTLDAALTISGGGTFFSTFLRAADGTLFAGTTSSDLYVAAPGTTTFTKRVGPRARCLGQRPGESRIFACGDGFLDGYNLGYSDDGAKTFQPMMTFRQIAGPLTCPAVQTACEEAYKGLLQTLGGAGDAGVIADGGAPARPGASGSCATASGGEVALLVLLAFTRRQRRPRRTS